MRSERAGSGAFAQFSARPGAVQDAVDRASTCREPPTRPSRSHKAPSGNSHVDVLQVVAPRAADGHDAPSAARRRAAGTLDASACPTGTVGRRCCSISARTSDAGPRATISPAADRQRRGPTSTIQSACVHRILVVLDDDQRVARVADSFFRVLMSLMLSRWCRPMVGSSRM